MTDPTPNRFTLRDLPLPAKLVVTCFLISVGIGYLWASGYIKFLVPHEKILRWVETKANLLGRLPHYVSVDQKTYGRYGVLPSSSVGVPLGGIPRSPETAA